LVKHPVVPPRRMENSRGATRDFSQLRSGWSRPQKSFASWRDAGFPLSRQDGFGFETNPPALRAGLISRVASRPLKHGVPFGCRGATWDFSQTRQCLVPAPNFKFVPAGQQEACDWLPFQTSRGLGREAGFPRRHPSKSHPDHKTQTTPPHATPTTQINALFTLHEHPQRNYFKNI